MNCQRLRALESFRSAATAVLVASDVAARGLDIPQIQAVLHYDVARSPQVTLLLTSPTESTGKQGGGGIMSIVSNAAAVGSMLESASKKQKTDGSA